MLRSNRAHTAAASSTFPKTTQKYLKALKPHERLNLNKKTRAWIGILLELWCETRAMGCFLIGVQVNFVVNQSLMSVDTTPWNVRKQLLYL